MVVTVESVDRIEDIHYTQHNRPQSDPPRSGPTMATDEEAAPAAGNSEPTPTVPSEPTSPTPTATENHGAAANVEEEAYSTFTVRQKRWIIGMASVAGFFSPLSSSIYFPALTTIAHDLHVTSARVNLTVTTYLVRNLLPDRGGNDMKLI